MSKLCTLEHFAFALALSIVIQAGYDKLSGNAAERKWQECISFGDSMSAWQEKYCWEFGA